jgi:hypothetical protein
LTAVLLQRSAIARPRSGGAFPISRIPKGCERWHGI